MHPCSTHTCTRIYTQTYIHFILNIFSYSIFYIVFLYEAIVSCIPSCSIILTIYNSLPMHVKGFSSKWLTICHHKNSVVCRKYSNCMTSYTIHTLNFLFIAILIKLQPQSMTLHKVTNTLSPCDNLLKCLFPSGSFCNGSNWGKFYILVYTQANAQILHLRAHFRLPYILWLQRRP